MSFIARLGFLAGTLLLLNAGHLSYKYHQFIKFTELEIELPLDIKIQVVAALVIYFMSSLFFIITPRKFNAVTGESIALKVPQNDSILFKPILMNKATIELEKMGGGPFDFIENKQSFFNVVEKRKEFNDWVISQEDEEDEEE